MSRAELTAWVTRRMSQARLHSVCRGPGEFATGQLSLNLINHYLVIILIGSTTSLAGLPQRENIARAQALLLTCNHYGMHLRLAESPALNQQPDGCTSGFRIAIYGGVCVRE